MDSIKFWTIAFIAIIIACVWFYATHPLKLKYWSSSSLPYAVQDIDERLTDLEQRMNALEGTE